ncbi:hypothetical protein H2199_002332 [Coniosporium tulheliwenetii]|uniref:Uncharacterized protein n=1 Tax=Coniosporium tulheliwenetii TaxID=3383036 RepID=A0ACC2ZIG3_9PEZI|nr:hypothetical protein H2199_002332 [Cladosporium sp. JES 115]
MPPGSYNQYQNQPRPQYQDRNRGQDQPRYQNQGQNQNRYGAFQGGSGNAPSGPRGQQGGRNYNSRNRELPYHLNAEVIEADLRDDLPTWILSEYGPGRNPPRGLFGSGIEMSPEEMRTLYYLGMANGNVQEAQQYEHNLVNQARQMHQKVLNDLEGALDYVIRGETEHPNRLDIVKQSMSSSQQNPNQGALLHNRPSTSSGGAFGRPSQPGSQTAFGRPSFGQSAAPNFGQQSATASVQPSVPPFGQSSVPAFGQPPAPSFGKPTLPAQPSAFGQPSSNPFGGASTVPFGTAPSGGFGQLNQNAQHTGAFGQPQPNPMDTGTSTTFTPMSTGGFGQPSGSAPSAPFGTSLNSTSTGGFGQPSGTVPPNPFGTAPSSTSTGGFGQPSGSAAPNPFSSAPAPTPSSGFGRPSNQALAGAINSISTATNGIPSSGGFGQPAIPPSVNPVSAASVLPPTASPLQPLSGHQPSTTFPARPSPAPLSTYAIYDRNNRLTTWKGRPVQYIPLPATEGADKAPVPHFQRQDNGDWERIWFPEGMPPANPDAAPDPQRWGEGFAKAYNFVWEKGEFFGGVMPEEPPGHEFVRWDV